MFSEKAEMAKFIRYTTERLGSKLDAPLDAIDSVLRYLDRHDTEISSVLEVLQREARLLLNVSRQHYVRSGLRDWVNRSIHRTLLYLGITRYEPIGANWVVIGR